MTNVAEYMKEIHSLEGDGGEEGGEGTTATVVKSSSFHVNHAEDLECPRSQLKTLTFTAPLHLWLSIRTGVSVFA